MWQRWCTTARQRADQLTATHLGSMEVWTNTFVNLDKYILQFGQIHLAIWKNASKNLNVQTERASADSQSFVEGSGTHATIPNIPLFRLNAFSTDFLYFCLSVPFVYFQIFDITSNVGTRPALA